MTRTSVQHGVSLQPTGGNAESSDSRAGISATRQERGLPDDSNKSTNSYIRSFEQMSDGSDGSDGSPVSQVAQGSRDRLEQQPHSQPRLQLDASPDERHDMTTASLTAPVVRSTSPVRVVRAGSAPATTRRSSFGADSARSTSTTRPRESSGGLKLTRRGRFVVRFAIFAVLVLATIALTNGLLGGGTAARAGAESVSPATSMVVVQPGQTMWSIANQVAPEHDAREVIARIKDLNHLTSAALVPGQALIVPITG